MHKNDHQLSNRLSLSTVGSPKAHNNLRRGMESARNERRKGLSIISRLFGDSGPQSIQTRCLLTEGGD